MFRRSALPAATTRRFDLVLPASVFSVTRDSPFLANASNYNRAHTLPARVHAVKLAALIIQKKITKIASRIRCLFLLKRRLISLSLSERFQTPCRNLSSSAIIKGAASKRLFFFFLHVGGCKHTTHWGISLMTMSECVDRAFCLSLCPPRSLSKRRFGVGTSSRCSRC